MNVKIIAEVGVNHNGDENLALQLIETAKECGADAVKFQTFTAEKLVRKNTDKAEYQKRETGPGGQYEMLKALEMSESLHRKLFARCVELGIEFMSTPFDFGAANFLVELGVKRIKIPSGEITNDPFLTFLAKKNLPLIMSTGMASLAEIECAVQVISAARELAGLPEPLNEMLTILHCTSNYPAQCENVNLRAMQTIAEKTRMPVGYSDHTLGLAVSTAAVALGAVIIEKHFTMNRNLVGPDHKASLNPDELGQLVRQIRDVEVALGSSIKQPSDSELPVRELVRRSVTVVRHVSAGSQIQRSDVALLRPGVGISPGELDNVIGKLAVHDLPVDTTLQWSDLK